MNKIRKVVLTKRLITVAILLVIVGIMIFFLAQPSRSVESYCKVYKQEKERLSKLPGNSYPSGVFNDEISDAGEFAVAFDSLAKVAPDEILRDIETLKKTYQVVNEDPSKAISASLSTGDIDRNVKAWTAEKCQ